MMRMTNHDEVFGVGEGSPAFASGFLESEVPSARVEQIFLDRCMGAFG